MYCSHTEVIQSSVDNDINSMCDSTEIVAVADWEVISFNQESTGRLESTFVNLDLIRNSDTAPSGKTTDFDMSWDGKMAFLHF